MNFFELILRLKKFDIAEAEQEIKRIQQMDKATFDQWHQNKRWEIVKHHFNSNPFYRKLLNNHLPASWEQLPVLQKKHLREPLKQMISTDYKLEDCYVSNTSGSSGTPLFYAKDKFAHAITWAIIKNRYSWFGITFESKQARFYGIPLSPIKYYSERLKDRLMNRYRFTVFDLSDHVLQRYLDRFSRTQFEFIYGYTNSMVLFARYLIKKQVVLKNICPTLTYCIATSEQCTDYDKQILEKAFGIPVLKEYGVSESDFVAMTDPGGKWKLSNEIIHIEVLDEYNNPVKEGEKGKLVITSLYNKAMPFIRYEVGDYGIIRKNHTGIQDELVDLSGRLNDTIYLPSGKVVPGFTLYYVSRQILEESGIMKEYTIKQMALNHFIFEVVSDVELKPEHKTMITRTAEEYLEPGLKIEVNQVHHIPKEGNGKFKHFHSYVKLKQ